MVSSITDETKEFIIHSNGEAGYVEVTSTSTLSEVRQLIIDEFDTEQLPSQSEEFAFKINGVRQSQKQETRKYAFELLEQQARVEIIPRVNNERKRKIDEALVANDDSISDNKKRLKIDASCAVTPFESSSSADNEKAAVKDKHDGGNAGDGDTSTAGTLDTSKSSSVGLPTNLDKKKFSTNDGKQEKNNSDLEANEMDSNSDDFMKEVTVY